jgi:demethylmenaquinone methyltransferase/2-methoxy-6-polyprenyl-1,4-benzoquinol methylase
MKILILIYIQNYSRKLNESKKYSNPEKLLQYSGIKSGQTVLEIGCGSGFFTIPASKMLGEEGKLYSIDINSADVNETQKKVNEAFCFHKI